MSKVRSHSAVMLTNMERSREQIFEAKYPR